MSNEMVYHPNNVDLIGMIIKQYGRWSDVMYDDGSVFTYFTSELQPVHRLRAIDPNGNMHTTN